MFNLKKKPLGYTLLKNNSGDISPHSFYLLIGIFTLILSLLITLTILIITPLLPPKLPLFYSLPWGESQLASLQQFFILPASIGIVTLINLIILWQLHPSQSFFKKILAIQSLLVSLILCIAFTKIVITFI